MHLTTDLKRFCRSNGADLVGVADLGPFKSNIPVVPHDLLDSYTHAVSVAIHLRGTVLDDITDHPTPEYAEHYRRTNASLDRLTGEVLQWITARRFHAHPVPASFIADEGNLLGNVSHKAVARMAGIGWQGKSLLIVSPEFGPRIRLATVLTDMPLKVDRPMPQKCGTCAECAKACPSSAIKNVASKDGYAGRDEALHFLRCVEKTVEFSRMPGIGARICGVCVKVCPFGRKAASKVK